MQIKGNLGNFSLFDIFLAVLFSSTETSETHWLKMSGTFVSIFWIKLILVSWSFVCKYYYSVNALVAEKSAADQIFPGLKSVRWIKKIRIIKLLSSQLSIDIALLEAITTGIS